MTTEKCIDCKYKKWKWNDQSSRDRSVPWCEEGSLKYPENYLGFIDIYKETLKDCPLKQVDINGKGNEKNG